VVAGERTAPLHDELLELRARLGVEDTVSFVGFREDIPELLRAMDLLLLTSAHEGFSLVAVQAMATGLPVVATRCGGPEEILTDGVDGILCPVADADALASALLALRADPSRRERMGREGRRSAEERFSLRAMVGRYEALYREALGG
jgi:glycosyltransferase involved in cell wall biosynthesis